MDTILKDLIDIHTNGQIELYAANIVKKDDYNILLSDLIDDQYWNFAYLTNNKVNLEKTWDSIKLDMSKENKEPLVYITSDILNEELEEMISKTNLNTLYTDVWMIFKNLENFGEYTSQIEFEVNKVDNDLKDKFIQAIMDGFSGDNPDEPYESLSEGYKIALEKSFENNNSEYKVLHYMGMHDEEAISTATAVYKNDKAIIYNVTTNKKYKKQGVCKKTMSCIINNLKMLGINTVCVQTEKGFYTEQVYKNMGFKEVMLGKAYIEDSKRR